MSKETNFAVSILTPVFNQSKYIAETIESVLSQDYPFIEYLVIDDGSTDNTLEIVKNYASKLKWQTQSNVGEPSTVNIGVNMLSGDLICIVNGDDPLLPGAVKTVVEKFNSQPELIAVYPDWKMIDADGQLLEFRKTAEYSFQSMIRGHDLIPGPGCFFRREAFLKLGGRDISFQYMADFEFFLRLGLEGPFARIPQTLACHRWYTEGTSTAARGEAMASEHIRLVEKIFALPNFPANFYKFKDEAKSSALFTAGVCCGENDQLRKEYFIKALRKSPWIYLWRYPRRTLEILRVFTPSIYRIIKRSVNVLRSRK